MTTRLLLVSTCGTSILTNNLDQETQEWLRKITNRVELSAADAGRLQEHVAQREEQLLNADGAERRKLSAELNGISAILEHWKPSEILHLLIETDTATGRATAKLVKTLLEKDRQPVQILHAGGLQAADFPSFREALADLTVQIDRWTSGYREKGWTTLFNLTGGFKSVNAYLQALGMFYADRSVFLFEGAATLMEIPRLPVKLAEADEIRSHLVAFRRLVHRYPVTKKEVDGVPDLLLLVDSDQAVTSVWGDVVWQRVRTPLLSGELLDPISPKLAVDKIRKDVKNLSAERRMQVNEALDELAAYLDLGHKLTESHQFEKLKGDPKPPSTHELYLWSDGAASRLFGHFEGDRFIADSIGPHL